MSDKISKRFGVGFLVPRIPTRYELRVWIVSKCRECFWYLMVPVGKYKYCYQDPLGTMQFLLILLCCTVVPYQHTKYFEYKYSRSQELSLSARVSIPHTIGPIAILYRAAQGRATRILLHLVVSILRYIYINNNNNGSNH